MHRHRRANHHPKKNHRHVENFANRFEHLHGGNSADELSGRWTVTHNARATNTLKVLVFISRFSTAIYPSRWRKKFSFTQRSASATGIFVSRVLNFMCGIPLASHFQTVVLFFPHRAPNSGTVRTRLALTGLAGVLVVVGCEGILRFLFILCRASPPVPNRFWEATRYRRERQAKTGR